MFLCQRIMHFSCEFENKNKNKMNLKKAKEKTENKYN